MFDKVLQVMKDMKGHQASHLYQDTHDRSSYLIISEWNDRTAFDAFVASDRFRNVDNCPDVPNADQVDSDANGLGDACAEPVEQPGPQNRPPAPLPPSEEFCGVCGAGGGSSVMLTLAGLVAISGCRRCRGRTRPEAGLGVLGSRGYASGPHLGSA